MHLWKSPGAGGPSTIQNQNNPKPHEKCRSFNRQIQDPYFPFFAGLFWLICFDALD